MLLFHQILQDHLITIHIAPLHTALIFKPILLPQLKVFGLDLQAMLQHGEFASIYSSNISATSQIALAVVDPLLASVNLAQQQTKRCTLLLDLVSAILLKAIMHIRQETLRPTQMDHIFV